jgi:hypothetical protein
MIIKRDPVKDQPEDGQEIFARAIDGENMLGEYGITDEGDPIFISDSTCGMDWSLVECWAPAEWTDGPTTALASIVVVGGEYPLDGVMLDRRDFELKVCRKERDDSISRAEKAEAYCAELVERATIAEDNANVALTHSVQLKRERDRAIEERDAAIRAQAQTEHKLTNAEDKCIEARDERDALGLQLAALRDQGERYAKALLDIKAMHRVTIVDDSVLLDDAISIACAALTHGVDVTKEGE